MTSIPGFYLTQTRILQCQNCELHENCRSPVPFTRPHSNSRVSDTGVLGEAPGRREDKLGRPFVGQSGKLLRLMLGEAGWNPEELWYMNSVSCWPHRTPNAGELNACWGNVLEQMRVSKCRYIVAAGGVALNTLVKDAKLQHCVGSVMQVSWLPTTPLVMPIWHPAYVLRNRYLKDDVVGQLTTFYQFSTGTLPIEWVAGKLCVFCGEQSMLVVNSVPCCGRCKPLLNANKKRLGKYQKWQNKRSQLSLGLEST